MTHRNTDNQSDAVVPDPAWSEEPLNSPIADASGKNPFTPDLLPPGVIAFYQPTRLGILHLLAWTAVAAILMSHSVSMDGPPSSDSILFAADPTKPLPPYGFVMARWAMQIIALAAMLFGSFILLRDSLRRAPGRFQPGHWILLAQCVLAVTNELIGIITAIVLLTFGPISYEDDGIIYLLIWLVSELTAAAICLTGIIRCPAGRLWRVFLGICSLGAAVKAMFSAQDLVVNFIARDPQINDWFTLCSLDYIGLLFYAPMVLLLVAVVRDVVARARRDWLHWLGLAMFLLATLRPLFFWVQDLITSI